MAHKLTRLALTTSLLWAAGCSGDKTKKAEELPKVPEAPAKDAAARAAHTPHVALPEADVAKVVDQWLAAQNAGDFDAYADRYATRMTGIKRVGAKQTTYDRKGWLADRQRMFRKPMKVERSGQTLHTSPTSAVVRFEQTWASGTFKDVGPKQLIIIREDGQLKIAREEMLASTVLRSKGGVSPAQRDLVFGAQHLEGFVLGTAPDDASTGEVTLSGSDPYIAKRAAKLDALPPEWTALIGKSLTVFDGAATCEDKVTELQIVSGVTPHFMFFQDENGERMDIESEGLEDDIFHMGTAYVVAKTEGACEGVMASMGTAPARSLDFAATTNDALATKAKQAFAASPESAALQSEFESYSDTNKGSWAVPSVQLFALPDGKHLAFVAASKGDGCGDFEGSLTLLFEVSAKGRFKPLGALPVVFRATSATDLGSDGLYEFVGETENYGDRDVSFVSSPKAGSEYGLLHRHSWDYHDCPC